MNETQRQMIVHLAVYEGLADWEVGHAIAHINGPDWQRTPGVARVVTVGEALDPVRTMGGVTVVPDMVLSDLRPEDRAMLILPGASSWLTGGNSAFVSTAAAFLETGVPVAAICGATIGLAAAGLLDDRPHTSNALVVLESIGYGGAAHFQDRSVVSDGSLITASAIDPVGFAQGAPRLPRSLRAAGARRLVSALRRPRSRCLHGSHGSIAGMRSETELVSSLALTVFRLNGQLLAAAEAMAAPSGLTAAWWQVLGAVLREPLPVSGIARAMGITRQSVQRIADLLVDKGLAEYIPNPAHRRAKLLRPTDEGIATVRRIVPNHAEFSKRVATELGVDDLAATLDSLERLSQALERIDHGAGDGSLSG